MSEIVLPEMLKVYYHRLFPFNALQKWLSYEHEELGVRAFERREFAFSLQDGIIIRYNSYVSARELKEAMQIDQPFSMDLGAEYNMRPERVNGHTMESLTAERRELVFDIDLSDYDDVRKCCKEGNICRKCWAFMKIAVKIIDRSLREDFDFYHILWVYSGRRGLHCWVCDKEARHMAERSRHGLAEYFNITPCVMKPVWRSNIFEGETLPHYVRRAVQIIDMYFEQVCLKDQEILKIENDMEDFLECIHDHEFAVNLKRQFDQCMTSVDRWQTFLNLYDHYLEKGLLKYNMLHIREELKMTYTFPRIDVNVTKGLRHLLKAPFCVHPLTGRICVPFNAETVDAFDPFTVSTIGELLDEIGFEYSESQLSESCISSTLGDAAIKSTGLHAALVVFEQFLQRLERFKGAPPPSADDNL